MQFRFHNPVMSVNVGVIKLCRLEKEVNCQEKWLP